MALQVWLPLNGNLNNQGCRGNSFSNSNTSYITSVSGGKVTSNCYNFNSSANNYGINSGDNGFMADCINNKSWSLCAWINTSSTETIVMSLSYGLMLFAGTSNKARITLYNSSRTVECYSSVAVNDGKWHHIVASYDVSTNIISFYVDGVVTGIATYTSGYTYSSSWSNGLFIGKNPNNSTVNDYYLYKGKLNDVRIYNHCLSVKEVKNLAKGLMLHYTLSRNGTNLLRNTSTEKSWSSTSTGSVDSNYSQDTITPSANSYYTMSFDAKSNKESTGKFITYLYNNSTGRQCDSVKGYIDGELVYTGTSADGACTMPTYTYYRHYVIVRHFNSNATALTKQNVFRIYNAGSSGLTMYVKNAKIEVGDKATPWIPNMTDVMSKNFPINSVSPSGYINQMTTYTLGPSSAQWVYTTLTPNGGGNYQPRIHRVRFKVTVLAGSFSSVTILFYNLSTSTGNTRVDAPIVNGYVDTFITPTTAVPNLLIYAGVAGATANNQIRIEDLLVYDQFNVSDNSGYSNNGSAINITDVYPDTPRYLTSYPFNGSNTYIYLPKNSARPKNAITISMWAWMSDWSTYNGRLISCTEGGGWNFEPSSSKMTFSIGTGTSTNTYKTVQSETLLSDLNALNNTHWHHFVGTYDGLACKIYIDGELEKTNTAYSTAVPIFYANNYTFIGAEAGGDSTTPASNYFNGRLSDVRIYATALSADDVKELYNVGASIDKNGNMHCYELVESV